jgi:hypothetical protein
MQLLPQADSDLLPDPCSCSNLNSFQQPHQQQHTQMPELASQLSLQQQQQQQQQQMQHCSIFLAGACPLASSEELLTLFAQFGRVMEINLHRPYKH